MSSIGTTFAGATGAADSVGKFYYADAANQPQGPLSIREIQEMIHQQKLNPDPNVFPESGGEWRALSAVLDKSPQSTAEGNSPAEASHPVGPAKDWRASVASEYYLRPTFFGDLLDKHVEKLRKIFSMNVIERVSKSAEAIGHFCIFAAIILGVIAALWIAIKLNTLTLVFAALLMGFFLCIGQFIAMRFLIANRTLIIKTPHCLSSRALLDSCALLSIIIAAIILASGLYFSLYSSSFEPLVESLVPSVFLLFFAALALHPEAVNIELADASGGEEAVGLIGFFSKCILKIAPIAYAISAISVLAVVIILLYELGSRGGGGFPGYRNYLPFFDILWELAPIVRGAMFLGAIFYACLIPAAAYFLFLSINLINEVIRAILFVPQLGKQLSNK